jgi:tRNA-2-methylthio-N6-dimethylallyladenosine synthase
MKRFHVHTFGCQMNAHDSRRIEEVLFAEGYAQADGTQDADLIVFNTCSVRDKADHKLLSAVGRLKELKAERPELVVAVAGCMAQAQGPALLERLEPCDILIGPDNIPELPALLREIDGGAPPIARTELDLEAPTFLRAHVHAERPEISAYVTVMKGCDERCTYCIVPYTRGAERYRPADDIVSEVRELTEGGVSEITLLGQTVNSWYEPGVGAGPVNVEAQFDGESQFAALLQRIAREVPELKRVRYTSPHPRHVTDALVRAHAELDNLPWHVHLPVQSGSDAVLKRMLRRYRRADYIARARALQAARPGFTLATDIIVGFPGETEADFLDTLSLVEEVGFVGVFGFKYSPRPHTPALKLEDDVPEQEKAERLARLFELSDRIQLAHLESLVGSETEVLFEGPSKLGEQRFAGRSWRHEIVHVDAPAAGVDLTGVTARVRVEAANKRSLAGTLVEAVVPSTRTRTRTGTGTSTPRGLRLPVMG